MMKHDPAVLGLMVAKKKPDIGAPPPFGGSSAPPTKPKVAVTVSAGKDPGADEPDDPNKPAGDDGTKAHNNLDEIMAGDPKVAAAMSALLQALCDEEKSEGDYGGGSDAGMSGMEGQG